MQINTKTILIGLGGIVAAALIYKIAARKSGAGHSMSENIPQPSFQPTPTYQAPTPVYQSGYPMPATQPSTFNPPPTPAHTGYQWVLGAGPSGPLWIQQPAPTTPGMHWQQLPGSGDFVQIPNVSSVAYVDPRPLRPSMIIPVAVPTPAN